MRKGKAEKIWTVEDSIREYEIYIQEQAKKILHAKELGVHQQSINKMLDWLAISKKTYDSIKRRYEAYGK